MQPPDVCMPLPGAWIVAPKWCRKSSITKGIPLYGCALNCCLHVMQFLQADALRVRLRHRNVISKVDEETITTLKNDTQKLAKALKDKNAEINEKSSAIQPLVTRLSLKKPKS